MDVPICRGKKSDGKEKSFFFAHVILLYTIWSIDGDSTTKSFTTNEEEKKLVRRHVHIILVSLSPG